MGIHWTRARSDICGKLIASRPLSAGTRDRVCLQSRVHTSKTPSYSIYSNSFKFGNSDFALWPYTRRYFRRLTFNAFLLGLRAFTLMSRVTAVEEGEWEIQPSECHVIQQLARWCLVGKCVDCLPRSKGEECCFQGKICDMNLHA